MIGAAQPDSAYCSMPDWCNEYLQCMPDDPDMQIIATRLRQNAHTCSALWGYLTTHSQPACEALIRAAIESAAKYPLPTKNQESFEAPDLKTQRAEIMERQQVFAEVAGQLEAIGARLDRYRNITPTALGVIDRAGDSRFWNWESSHIGATINELHQYALRNEQPAMPDILWQLAQDLKDIGNTDIDPYDQAAIKSQKVSWKGVFRSFLRYLDDISRIETKKNSRDSGYLPTDNTALAVLMCVTTGVAESLISADSIKNAKAEFFQEQYG